MDLFLDPTRTGDKISELFEQLREAIVSGRLAAGDRLPPTREVASQLDVSRSTVTTVYGRLAAEGYIEGRAGAGSYVSPGLSSTSRSLPQPAALKPVFRAPASAAQWALTGFEESPPKFDLRTGRPDPALFPLADWRRCMTTAMQISPGGYVDPAGLPALRRAIAQWIGRSRAVEANPDQLIITSGAQQGIDLVTRLLVAPGEAVAVEDPGYPPVAALLAASGVEVLPVPVDSQGIVVDRIPTRARLVYTTPSHQAPTGVTMSMARRRELLRFAESHNVGIIEDDYDSEYRHADRPLEPLHRLDRHGRVIYVGTFSKTLSPSLRLGFIVLPHSLAAPAVALRSLIDWHPPATLQATLLRFIVDGHLERYLRRTRKIYTERHRMVSDFVAEAVDDGLLIAPERSYAGLHITTLLPPGRDEATIREAAGSDGIALGHFAHCWQRQDAPAGLVIGFGAVPTADLPDALGALRHVLTG
ncbi:MAG: PLP-dependent aminotransferase family protein [Acidimicrobiales bacterium]